MTDTAQDGGGPPLVEVNPFFGGFVLETLTIGLYGEARSAIREYLQNGLDSVLLAVDRNVRTFDNAKIDVTIEHDALVIRDNGIGLERGRVVGTLTSVGASLKDFRVQAGFRGIGRLAGIAFCNTLTFLTKAKGETVLTRVVFDAKQLRKDMSPSGGGQLSLHQLLSKNVKATQPSTPDVDSHYFEVRLEGLVNAPAESTDVDQMVDFISQVAPVAYADDLTFKAQIEEAAAQRRFSKRPAGSGTSSGLEVVRIFVHAGARTVEVRKPYHTTYTVGRDDVNLSDIMIRDGESKKWWGWVGLKREPGTFKGESTQAIRIRVRNIQIDGTEIMGGIFADVPDAKSYGRFNDWYVGEIFGVGTLGRKFARWLQFRSPSSLQEVKVAITTSGLSIGLRLAIEQVMSGVVIFALTYPAVAIATLIAGWRSGLLTVLICQVTIGYLFLPVENS